MATQLSPRQADHFSEIKSGATVAHIESSPLTTPFKSQNTIITAPLPATNLEATAEAEKWKNIKTVALVVHEPKTDFKLETIYLDEVREDEILVEMKYSGICHTDIVMQQGLIPLLQYPAILGHEGSGVILSLGSSISKTSPHLKVGDSVLLSFNYCANCPACTSTPPHPALCHTAQGLNFNSVRGNDRSTPARLENGTSVRSQFFGQSSFAKRSVVCGKSVVKFPSTKVDGEVMGDWGDDGFGGMGAIYAPLGCGIQTGAGTVLNVLKPGPKDSIVIFGMGTVGLAALMAAKYLNASQIIAVDIVSSKLEMAMELGATDVINSLELAKRNGDLVETIQKLTHNGRGVQFAIDCTGILTVIESMIECLGPQGTAATLGVPPVGSKIAIDAFKMMTENKKYIGVIEGDAIPAEFIPKMIEMHREGKFPVERLIKTYPVEKLQVALDDMHAGRVIKPVISWG